MQQEKEIDVPALLDIVQSVVSKADTDADLCEMLSFMEASSEKLYAHAIHVALYGRLLAGWVQLTSEDTELVVLTGLLHDIGHLKGMEKAENSLWAARITASFASSCSTVSILSKVTSAAMS